MKKILLSIFYCFIVFLAKAQPANDNPANAVSIPIGTSYYASTISGTTIAATKTTGLCCSSSGVYDDVWYKFEVTGAANSNVSITVSNVIFSPVVPNYLQMYLWNGALSTIYAGTSSGVYNQFNLGIGTWYLQVWTDGNATTERSSFDISIKALPSVTVANDNCGGAINLTPNVGSCISVTGYNTAATTSTPAPALATGKNDVWYKFTAAATSQLITISDVLWAPGIGYPNITGSATANINIELGQGLCGTYAAIGNVTGNAYNATGLNIGTEYFIRVSSVLTNTYARYFDFNICVSTPPSNDEAATATPIIPATGNCFAAAGITDGTFAASPSVQPTCIFSSTHKDVWYSFTATNNYFKAFLDIATAVQSPSIELWNAAATTRIACVENVELASAVNNGTAYKLRVAGYPGTFISYNLKTLCTAFTTPPTNDNCSTPKTLPLNNSISTAALMNETTASASQETSLGFSSSCAGSNSGSDLWYSFTASKTSVTIALRNIVTTGSTNMIMQVYPTGCSSTTPLAFVCGNLLTVNTVPGNFYALRVMKADGCETVTFDLHTELPPSPINDECVNAANLPSTFLENCNTNILRINGSTINATQSSDALGGICFGNNDDVWFRFIIGFGSVYKYGIIVTDKVASSITSGAALKYELYSGSGGCASKTFIECGDISSFGEFTQFATNLPTGVSYYMRIFSSDYATEYSFKIGIVEINASTNITCGTASTLIASTSSGAYTFGNTLGVPTDEADCFGGSTGSRGVWYNFVATATTHLLDMGCVYSLGNGSAFAQAKVFSGACGALTQLFCFNNISTEGGTMTGLTIGQTYSILIIDYTPNSEPIIFSVRVITSSSINDESVTAISLIQDVICLSTLASTNFSTLSVAPALAAHPLGYTYIGDVWYKFTASTSTVNLSIANNTNDFFFKVYNSALSSAIAFDAGATGALSSGGGSFSLSGLTVGQNYYIRVVLCAPPPGTAPLNGVGRNFNICVWGLPTTTIADGAIGVCAAIDGPVTSTNNNIWKHFTDAGKLLASIFDNPGGTGMGIMNGNYYRNVGPIRTWVPGTFATALLDRNFEITPTTQPINPVRVKFYYTKQELDSLISHSRIRSPNDLRLAKNSLVPCGSTIGSFWPASYSRFYTPTSFGEINPNLLFLEFEFPSFSSFFIGTDSLILLPTKIENITASLNDNKVQINWTVNQGLQINKFEIERSFDGLRFEKIGVTDFTGKKEYIYNDVFNFATTYYRIKMILANGNSEYSKTVVVKSIKQNNEILIYPNPVNENTVQVSFNIKKSEQVHIQIIDNVGKTVLQKQLFATQGNHTQTLNIQALQTGNYYLSVLIDGKWVSKNFTKVN